MRSLRVGLSVLFGSVTLMLVVGCGGGGSPGPNTGSDIMVDSDGVTNEGVNHGDVIVDGDAQFNQDGEISRDFAGNHIPVANAQEITCTEDQPCKIVLTGTDEDNDTLSFFITVPPSNGELSGIDENNKVIDTAEGVTYTPSKDFTGSDSFQFYAFDGKQKSDVVVVDITVKSQNDAPVAQDITDVTTQEDNPVTFKLKATDTDGDALTYTVDSGPSNGTIEMGEIDADGYQAITYTPATNFAGTDTLTYHANDGTTDSNTATVTITVTPVEDPPIAISQTGDQAVTTDEDTPVDITLQATDPDAGDTVTISIVDQPAHGQLTEVQTRDGEGTSAVKKFTYTPDKDFNGSDSFTFKATDSTGQESDVATVEITVNPVNDAPFATDQPDIETDQDTPVDINLSVVDVDGDTLTFKLKDVTNNGPKHGTVTFAEDGSAVATYTPEKFFPKGHTDGQDGFVYEACDPSGACVDATVTITVHPVNDPPQITDQTVDTNEDTPVDITLMATDPDDDPITFSIPEDKGPQHGTATIDNGIVHYIPEANWPQDKAAGPQADTFTVQACDDDNACNDAVMTVNVTPVEDAPTAKNQAGISVDQGQSVDIKLETSDADDDPLTYTVTDGPAHGKVTFDADTGTATYTPDQDFPQGHQDDTDSFTYKVCDDDGQCKEATVTITVKSINLPPALQDQTLDTDEDTPLDIPLDAKDPNGDTVTYTIMGSGPQHGTAVLDNGKITYTPDKDWPADKTLEYGEDQFTVKACDGYVPDANDTGEGACVQAVFTIHVKPVNDTPQVIPFTTTTTVNQPIVIQIQATDADNDTLKYKFVDLSKLHGTLYKVDADGNQTNDQINEGDQIDSNQFAFVPENNYTTPDGSPDSVVIQAYDGEIYSPNTPIWIVVKGSTNHAPKVDNITVKTQEGVPIDIKLTGTDEDGDPLHFWITGSPAANQGKLTNVADNGLVNGDTVTFIPAAHFNGTARFMFQADDGMDRSNFAVVTVKVVPVNNLPTTLPVNITVDEDSTKDNAENKLEFKATDPDDDVSTLTYKIVTLPEHGTLYRSGGVSKLAKGDIVTDGVVLFEPDPNWPMGHDPKDQVFQYAACDNHDPDVPCGDPADATITVKAEEDQPTATDQDTITTDEDTSTNPIVLTVKDADCDELTFTVKDASPRVEAGMASVKFEQNGTDDNGCPIYQVIYTPVPNWPVGHDDKDAYFTYQADDGNGGQVTAKVTVTVHAINDAPDAKDVTVEQHIDEDSIQPLTVNLADSVSDPDGDTVTYSVDDTSQNGGTVSVDQNTGKLSYVPPANWPCNRAAGPQVDTLTYHVDDGFGGTSTAHVYITVNPVEDVPKANNLNTLVLQESNNNLVTLEGSDDDCNETLTYYIVDQPEHGSLSNVDPATGKVNGSAVLYTPTPGYKGPDFFTYKVNDGLKDSAKATVTITVKAVNHKPTVENQSASTPEDNPVTITLEGNDQDGDQLTFRIKDRPQHGTLGAITQVDDSHAQVVYTPVANYNGPDSFTFIASDGIVDSDPGTVTITVTPVNDPPVADDKTAQVNEDDCVDITLTATDVEGDTLTYGIASQPANGTVQLAGNVATYCPNKDWPQGHDDQTDTFTYKVNDGNGGTDTATVQVTVHPINDAPVAQDKQAEVSEDQCVDIDVTATDADGDSLIYTVTDGPSNGRTVVNGSTVRYCPDRDWPAGHDDQTDSFTYKVDDGNGGTATATVQVTVHPVNDVPVADDQSTETDEDNEVTITLQTSDADNDTLTYTTVTAPAHGSVTYDQAGKATYTPDPDWPAGHDDQTDSFTYEVNDGHGGTATATVTITVHPVEDAPVANDQTEATTEDTPVTFALDAHDADNDTLTYTRKSGPSYGTLTIDANGNATYTPNSDWPQGHTDQTDSFTYEVDDGHDGKDTATVTITVHPVNDRPVIEDIHTYTPSGHQIQITLPKTDADGDTLHYSLVEQPSYGEYSISGNTLTYSPKSGTYALETLTYKADDQQGESNSVSETKAITIAIGVRFVDKDAPGTGTGFTWEDAFTTVQAGINAAQTYNTGNDQVWVKKGTYPLADTVKIKAGIELYGAFNGTEETLGERSDLTPTTADNQFTTLDGQNDGFTVVEMADDTALDGFIVENGNSPADGGGITSNASNVVIANTRVHGNSTGGKGGGIAVSGGDIQFRNVAFNNNTADARGGGIYASNCEITLMNVTIKGNTAKDDTGGGGGIYLKNVTNGLNWRQVKFISNSAVNGNGGGMLIEDNDGTMEMDRVWFESNTAHSNGGAIYIYGLSHDLDIKNAVFWDNSATSGNGGAVMYTKEAADLHIVNASFADNVADNRGGAVYCSQISIHTYIMNSNLAHDSANKQKEIHGYNSYNNGLHAGYCAQVDYSVIDQASMEYDSGIVRNYKKNKNVATSTDPGYTNHTQGDLTLKYCHGDTDANNDAIDRANGDYAPVTDIDNNPRINYPGVDNDGKPIPGTNAIPDSGAFECPAP